MKKNYLFGMALMASLAFFSCTNEVIYVHDGESSEQVSDEQIITLQVSNGGDGLTTRAGRPLYSSEAKQAIDYVRLWIFDSNGLKYSTTLENWNSGSTEYGESSSTAHGREAKIPLSGDNKLATGTQYTVYAIGYHSTGAYNSSIPATSSVVKTDVENLKLNYTAATNDCAEEIFAGSYTFTPDKDAFNQTIVLNRQVAGAFVYLKDIPYFDDAATLELVASSTNNQLVLGQFANTDFGSNGNNTVSLNVINGWNSEAGWTIGKAKETVIASITLSDWFSRIKDEDNDGLIDLHSDLTVGNEYANWKNKYATQSPKPTFQKGSVFAGTFLIPFSKVNETQTLKLVMKAGQTSSYKVLASWNINLSATGNNYANLYTWNGSTFGESSATETLNKNSYSIVRNHLYGIGTRMNDQANPNKPGVDPDPDKPEEKPDPDIDDPESLNNKQELTLRVNDNWEVIHGMELE